jgi:hypothetical protein
MAYEHSFPKTLHFVRKSMSISKQLKTRGRPLFEVVPWGSIFKQPVYIIYKRKSFYIKRVGCIVFMSHLLRVNGV